MEKEFVPYEQALALKELGFNEPCLACVGENNEVIIRVGDYRSFSNKKPEDSIERDFYNNIIKDFNSYVNDTASAPTFSQAFRWFRENFGILVIIDMQKSSGYGLNSAFFHTIKVPTNQIQFKIITNVHDSKEELFEDWISKKAHKTYEEAQLECLKKLIEIVNG